MEKDQVKQQEKERENTTAVTQELEKVNPIKATVMKAKIGFEATNEHQMNFNKEASFAIQILKANDFLAKKDPQSIINSINNISKIGLTLNPALKYAYLVPRGDKCVLDVSYIGMIKILTDAGAVKNIDAGVIYSNDEYDFRKGTDPYFKHKPALANRGDKIGAYAIAFFRDGGTQFEILSKDDIEKIRNTSESWKNEKARKYSPWETWEDEMWKKSALKRLFKLLPKTKFSDELIAAVSTDHENEVNDLTEESKYNKYFDEIPEAETID